MIQPGRGPISETVLDIYDQSNGSPKLCSVLPIAHGSGANREMYQFTESGLDYHYDIPWESAINSNLCKGAVGGGPNNQK